MSNDSGGRIAPEPDGDNERPRRFGNEFAVGAAIVGVVAVIVSLATATAVIPAVLGLILSAWAIVVGVRRDAGMNLALTGLLLNLLALVVAVFSAGIAAK